MSLEKKSKIHILLWFIVFVSTTVAQERGVVYSTSEQIKSKYIHCYDSTVVRDCEKAATDLSFIGLHQEALKTYNICHPKTYNTPEEIGRVVTSYKPIPAKEYILKQAKNRQVIMLNENHSSSHHRAFTASLLKGLKELGYTHLGLEGVRDASVLEEKGYPTKKLGFYVADPQYANMIRLAKDLGFIIFDYDTSQVTPPIRELTQAKKIAQVLSNNPDSKIVIHAGGGHIREDTLYYGGLMAYQFKKMTGIDPLTINQTRMNEQSSPDYEHFFYKDLKGLCQPSFLINSNTKTLYTDSATDLILFHPRTTYKWSRPSWLYKNKNYYSKQYKLNDSLTHPILILAFYQEEKDLLTIPVDAIELGAKTKKTMLFFPKKGIYDIAIQTKDGQIKMDSIIIK